MKVINNLASRLQSTKGLLTSLGALLVVLASLINGGRDLYVSLSGAPRTQEEADQAGMFRKHHRESPAFTQPLNVELENWTVRVILDVYANGDIYLTVGPNSSWFPFTPVKKVSLASEAYAETAADLPSGKYIQNQREEGRNIVRERIYDNGVRESLVIDRNTGRILNRSTETRPLSLEERAKIETGVPAKPPIDIKIR